MEREDCAVVNLDKLTYAGNPQNLERIASNPKYKLVQGDIADRKLVEECLQNNRPQAIVHFAAEATSTVPFSVPTSSSAPM